MCLQQEKGSAKTKLGDNEKTEIHLGAFVQFPILHMKNIRTSTFSNQHIHGFKGKGQLNKCGAGTTVRMKVYIKLWDRNIMSKQLV